MSDPQQPSNPEAVPTAPPYAPAGSPTAPPQQDPYLPGHMSAYAASPGYPVAAPRTGRNPLGLVGAIVGLAGMVVGFVMSLTMQGLFINGSWEAGQALSTLSTIIAGLCGVVALVCGLIALRSPEGKGIAGIATGLGIAGTAGVLFVFLQALMLPLFSSATW